MVVPGGRTRTASGGNKGGGEGGIRKPPRAYPEEGRESGHQGDARAGIQVPGRRESGEGGARVAQTTTERLAREATLRDPDTRIYKAGAPLATLRHVMYGCVGTPERQNLKEKVTTAVRALETAVPLGRADVGANRAYRKLLHEARAALEATDEAALRESHWEALGDVLAGCVPDFCRHMPP